MGLSAARAFIQHGARLVIVGRNSKSLDTALAELGSEALGIVGDAGEPDTAFRAITLCRESFGKLDGLYHVAGGSGRKMGDGPLHELTLEGWNKTLAMNITSLMLSNQAAVRQFLEQGTGGTILNMGSILGTYPSPQFFTTHAYAAAKSAAIGFSRSIAAYYAKQNIRVNMVTPGLVETPMSGRASGDEAIMDFIHRKQPLDGGRIGKPADLDGIALYFMSDESRFTTGQVVAIDGGWNISEGL